jgi:hypothetical protein
MTEILKVKKFAEYQHYKDRNPPWIKLHAVLLDDYKFTQLADEDKWLLVGLFLLASRTDNHIPNDPNFIQSRLSMKKKPRVDLLLQMGFLEVEQDASKVLQSQEQVVSMSGRSEEERRGETEKSREETASPTSLGAESEDDKDSPSNLHANREWVMAWWNDLAAKTGIAQVREITDTRWRRCRTVAIWDRAGEIEEALLASRFCREGGWFSFDWVTKRVNMHKLIEGNYSDERRSGNGNGRLREGPAPEPSKWKGGPSARQLRDMQKLGLLPGDVPVGEGVKDPIGARVSGGAVSACGGDTGTDWGDDTF